MSFCWQSDLANGKIALKLKVNNLNDLLNLAHFYLKLIPHGVGFRRQERKGETKIEKLVIAQ
jgi:hypothetical protein